MIIGRQAPGFWLIDLDIHSDTICKIQPNSKYWDGNAIYLDPSRVKYYGFLTFDKKDIVCISMR